MFAERPALGLLTLRGIAIKSKQSADHGRDILQDNSAGYLYS